MQIHKTFERYGRFTQFMKAPALVFILFVLLGYVMGRVVFAYRNDYDIGFAWTIFCWSSGIVLLFIPTAIACVRATTSSSRIYFFAWVILANWMSLTQLWPAMVSGWSVTC